MSDDISSPVNPPEQSTLVNRPEQSKALRKFSELGRHLRVYAANLSEPEYATDEEAYDYLKRSGCPVLPRDKNLALKKIRRYHTKYSYMFDKIIDGDDVKFALKKRLRAKITQ
jgi:hypothetical protein